MVNLRSFKQSTVYSDSDCLTVHTAYTTLVHLILCTHVVQTEVVMYRSGTLPSDRIVTVIVTVTGYCYCNSFSPSITASTHSIQLLS